VGVVNRKDMQGNFGNALMKAVTKAKRRVTLSICGLGMLDETEVETIPSARPVTVQETGEIVEGETVEEPGQDKQADNPFADLEFQAQKSPTTAFWLLQKRMGIAKSDAEEIITACGRDFVAAFQALLRQAKAA
jgi:hypothetical protein